MLETHIPTLSLSICRTSPERNITQGYSSRLLKSLSTCLETRLHQGKVKQTERTERSSDSRVGSVRSVRIGIHLDSVLRLPESAHYAACLGLPLLLPPLPNIDRHPFLLHLYRHPGRPPAGWSPSPAQRAPSSTIPPFLSVRYARRSSLARLPFPL